MDPKIIVVFLALLVCGLGIVVLGGLGAVAMILSAHWDQKWLNLLRDVSAQRGWKYQASPNFRLDCVITGQHPLGTDL